MQRRLRLNNARQMYVNGCHVEFKVQEVLKGTLDQHVLVEALYDDQVPFKEKLSYKHCYIDSGKTYIVSGRAIKSDASAIYPIYVLAGKDIKQPPRYACPPVEQLPEGNALVTEIKNILEKKQ